MNTPDATSIIDTWPDSDGRPMVMRPLVPADAPLLRAGFKLLSPQTRYQRFFSYMREMPESLVHKLSHPDRRCEYALIVVKPTDAGELPIAVGRFAHHEFDDGGEFALVVGDPWQGHGIGRRLLQALIAEARRRGRGYLDGSVLATNDAMFNLARSMGFTVHDSEDGANVKMVRLDLAHPEG